VYVELGKIVGVWGVKGWVKLHSYTRHRADIAQYKTWKDPSYRAINVLRCREQAKGIVAQLENIDDRDQAAAMTGLGIWVKESDLPVLPDGEFYWQQLIGLTVANSDKEIGVVQSLLETGANDVLVCKSVVEGEAEFLLPYTDEVVLEIDLQAGTMVVEWDPDYLLD